MTRMSIGAAIRTLAHRAPTALAVRDRDRALDRAGLVDEAERWCAALDAAGVVHGDHVSVFPSNRVDDVSAIVAIWMLGATPQTISPRLVPSERRRLVALGDCRVTIGDCRVTIGDTADESGAAVALGSDAWRTTEDRLTVDRVAPSWKASTSGGSTGAPKLVVSDAPSMVDPDLQVAEFLPCAARQLVVSPLSHSAPFTYAMRGLMTGHELVLEPSFEPAETLSALARERISWVMLVPTMMTRILRLPAPVRESADLSNLEAILHIGSRVAPWVKRGWIDWIGASRVLEVYAGSESAGVAMIRGEEWLAHPGSVGRGIGGSRFRVVDDDGAEVAPGKIGLIQMRRSEPAGYHYRGSATPPRDAWHTLGDLGRMDADGWIYLAERAHDVIRSDGERTFPSDLESAAESHPEVRSAIAVDISSATTPGTIGVVVDLAGARLTSRIRREITRLIRNQAAVGPVAIRIVDTDRPVRDDAGKTRRRDWLTLFG